MWFSCTDIVQHILMFGTSPHTMSLSFGAWSLPLACWTRGTTKIALGIVLTYRGKVRALAATGHDPAAAGQAPYAVPDLRPGEHYKVRESLEAHEDWLPLSQIGFTKEYWHTWVLVRNRRPKDPSFFHCPMPRGGVDIEERNAAIDLTYFHPIHT